MTADNTNLIDTRIEDLERAAWCARIALGAFDDDPAPAPAPIRPEPPAPPLAA